MSLRIAALGLLKSGPGSGYDLIKRSHRHLANIWPATQSQLYGELARLASAGLIEVSTTGPRGRKEYRLTDQGRAELSRWLTTPHKEKPSRSPARLQLFLLGELSSGQAREHLLQVTQRHEAECVRLAALRDTDDVDSPLYHRAALDLEIRMATTTTEWARELLTEIEARGAVGGP
jgi:DNA-binding PadR family transcriptional regulator